MPYIKIEKRPQYDAIIKSLMQICEDAESGCPVSNQNQNTDAEIVRAFNALVVSSLPNSISSNFNEWKGELNYLISKFCHELIKRLGLRYHVVNDIIGMLAFNQALYSTFGRHASSGWKNIFMRFVVGLTHLILHGDRREVLRKCEIYIKNHLTKEQLLELDNKTLGRWCAFKNNPQQCTEERFELIGVLECIKLELYRMVAARYENSKSAENGSVSELDDRSMERIS